MKVDALARTVMKLFELHGHAFDSQPEGPINLEKNGKVGSLVSRYGHLGVFINCTTIPRRFRRSIVLLNSKGEIRPAAMMCQRKLLWGGEKFDRGYAFSYTALFEHLVCSMQEALDVDLLDKNAYSDIGSLFEQEHLPHLDAYIADLCIHEMRHEAQFYGAIHLRAEDFIIKSFPDMLSEAEEEWNRANTTISGSRRQRETYVRNEKDAFVTGLAARWIWRNNPDEAARLQKVKELVFG